MSMLRVLSKVESQSNQSVFDLWCKARMATRKVEGPHGIFVSSATTVWILTSQAGNQNCILSLLK
jgi:hypothetical protein